MSVRLRRMTTGDLPAVTALERDLFPEDPWPERMFAGELGGRRTDRFYLVAEDEGQDEGQIVGYAGLLAPPEDALPGGQGDVLTMAVARSRWGEGIGSQLLEELLAEAARRRCSEVFLEVRADNPRAQQLYARHGFTVIGRRRGYYQPSGTDAIVMRRNASALPGAGARGARVRPEPAAGGAGACPRRHPRETP
jgi:[ribosomal protein S18]-alanine N-acetyltransferase